MPPWNIGCTLVRGTGTCSEFSNCNAPTQGECVSGLCVCKTGFTGISCGIAIDCQYWDPDLGAWSKEGVTPSPPPNNKPDGFMYCKATHLTEFGGLVFPSSTEELVADLTPTFNTMSADELFDTLSAFDFLAYPVFTGVIFGLLGANIVCQIFLGMWRARRRRLARLKAGTPKDEEEQLQQVRAIRIEELKAKNTAGAKLQLEFMQKGAACIVDRTTNAAGRVLDESAKTTASATGKVIKKTSVAAALISRQVPARPRRKITVVEPTAAAGAACTSLVVASSSGAAEPAEEPGVGIDCWIGHKVEPRRRP